MSNDTLKWYGNDDSQALVTEAAGRLLASVQHDGYGKFAVSIYASLFSGTFWRLLADEIIGCWQVRDHARLRWLWLNYIGRLGWRSFPLVRVPLGDRKGSIAYARECAEHYLAF